MSICYNTNVRILYICPTLPDSPEKDGMTQVGYFLIRELAQRHAITVWAAGEANEPTDAMMRLGVRETKVFLIHHRSLLSYYTIGSRFPWYQTRRDSPALHIALQTLAPNQFDLIVLHSPFVAQYIHDISGVPVVIQAMDALSTWFFQTASTERKIFKRLHLRAEGRRATISEARDYRLARAVTFVSPKDVETIERVLPREHQVEYIPIGIDQHTFYPPSEPRQSNTIIFTGIMDYPPNIEAAEWFVQHVWPALKQEFPDLAFRLVGKNPAPEVIRLGHTPGVTVTGRVPSMADELRATTLAVSPLQHGTGFKIKIMEALACGTPLVATPVSIPGTGVEPNVQARIVTTPTEWISTIRELLTTPAKRQALSEAALRLAEQFRWSSVAKQVEGLYDSSRHG